MRPPAAGPPGRILQGSTSVVPAASSGKRSAGAGNSKQQPNHCPGHASRPSSCLIAYVTPARLLMWTSTAF